MHVIGGWGIKFFSKKLKKCKLQMHWSLRGKISAFASMMHVQVTGASNESYFI